MWLEKLELTDFRSYKKAEVHFNKRLVFITGPNGSGKTNLLEAVSLLSLGKSFRGIADKDLIKHGSAGYFVRGKFRKGSSITELEYAYVSVPESRKRIRINGKVASGRSDLIGHLVTVIFNPSDLKIIEGGPPEKRRFADILLSGINPSYFENLLRYNHALRQRNVLLKKIREKKDKNESLYAWDSEIIRHAKSITEERISFIEKFRPFFRTALESISSGKERGDINLVLSDPDETISYKDLFKKNYYKDLAAGSTTAGPHRHNLEFLIAAETGEFRNILTTGSQGQKRSTALALRIAEFYHIRENLKMPPLLLIDDVIRELDAQRRASFIKLLHECGQAIFTTPDLDGLDEFIESLKSDVQIINITPEHSIIS